MNQPNTHCKWYWKPLALFFAGWAIGDVITVVKEALHTTVR